MSGQGKQGAGSGGSILIHGGRVVGAEGVSEADVLIEHGRVTEVRPGLLGSARLRAAEEAARGAGGLAGGLERLDAAGQLVFPGLTDPQVHFREPGMPLKEDLGSGSLAALAGGVTGFMEMPNTNPNTDSPERLEEKLERAAASAVSDYAFFLGGTHENADQIGEWEDMPGCAGIKVFMGSSTGSLLVPDNPTLERILRSGKRRVTFHSEDDDRLKERYAAVKEGTHVREHPHVRDVACAVQATTRLLDLAELTGRPIHILHVSTADEIRLVRERDLGELVTVELTPNHLFLTAPDCYEGPHGTWAQMNPPVRDRAHQEVLREAAADGTAACIGSDHAPHTLEDKAKPFPASSSGIAGVQTTLPLLLTAVRDGWLRHEDIVRLCVQGPSRVYGARDRGPLAPGALGHAVLVDPSARGTIGERPFHSRAGHTPFADVDLAGWPTATVLHGRVAYQGGQLVGERNGQRIIFR
ncbi:Dihydroorotase [Planctomycetes bacterium Poly30]|uniref:Dihydroorotase n=1 Tax=Saltatorellus ferox TaxID=2528018 RepID=A0A518EWW1_9BACT|nr:Dihydroorotase [Planctomycetes bacterium Poly30]